MLDETYYKDRELMGEYIDYEANKFMEFRGKLRDLLDSSNLPYDKLTEISLNGLYVPITEMDDFLEKVKEYINEYDNHQGRKL